VLANHAPVGARVAHTSHNIAYAMAIAATPSLGSDVDSSTARSRYAPAIPSMALPSTENTPPASAKGSVSPACSTRDGIDSSAGTALDASEGCSSASTRRSSISRRVASRFKASGRSSIHSTRREALSAKSLFRSIRRCGFWHVLFRPRRQQLYQHPQKDQREDGQSNGHQQALMRDQAHLVSRVPEKTLAEQLSADHNVPAHGEDANQGQASSHNVNPLARDLRQLDHLGYAQQDDGRQRAQADLDHDVGDVELGVDQEVQAAERFVGLVDAVDQVQHLQAEVDDEDVEQVHRDGVHAVYVDLLLAQLRDRHVEQHHRGNS